MQSFATPSWTAIGLGHVGYPSIVLWVTLGVLQAYLLLGIIPMRARAGRLSAVLPPSGEPRLRLVAFILLWVGYAVIMPYTGFAVATVVTLAASLMLLDRFAILKVTAGALAATLVVYVAFRRLLYVGMPSGSVEAFLDRILYSL